MMPEKEIPARSTEVVAYLNVGLLAAALFLAFYVGDEKTLFLIIGAVIANSTTVTNFIFGSSKGSQAKDATISAFGSALATSSPGMPVPPMRPVEPPEPIPAPSGEPATLGEGEGGATRVAERP